MKKETKQKRNTLCKKITLYPLGSKEEVTRVYNFIRDGQYMQYKGLNLIMGQLASQFYKCNSELDDPQYKEWVEQEIRNTNSLLQAMEFPKGIDSRSLIIQRVKQDFSSALKNGLARGERSITNYKRTLPLMTRGRDLKFSCNYSELEELEYKCFSKDFKVYVSWVNKIKFKVVLGSVKRSLALRKELCQILRSVYSIQGSSIEIKDKKIILNLSMGIPLMEKVLDENTVVGVDLGIAVPAVCGLNTNKNTRRFIGSKDDLLKIRTKVQSQRKSLNKKLRECTGGHGRSKKLQALDRLSESETNYVKTYLHMVSKEIIRFAVAHNAKYINIEKLEGYDASSFILRNWSYYQLQSFIEYKAKIKGIIVRKVNPYHTSQICSYCGHWEEGQRLSQDKFKCKCCGVELNADFNASRNIALSTEFVE